MISNMQKLERKEKERGREGQSEVKNKKKNYR